MLMDARENVFYLRWRRQSQQFMMIHFGWMASMCWMRELCSANNCRAFLWSEILPLLGRNMLARTFCLFLSRLQMCRGICWFCWGGDAKHGAKWASTINTREAHARLWSVRGEQNTKREKTKKIVVNRMNSYSCLNRYLLPLTWA